MQARKETEIVEWVALISPPIAQSNPLSEATKVHDGKTVNLITAPNLKKCQE